MNGSSKEKKVHNVFESISEKYDSMNSIISFNKHKSWRKDVMNKMNVQADSDALDVCTGTGDWAISLAEEVGESGHVVGLDFSKNMLSIAEEKNKEYNIKQLDFIHGNAMDLPFESNSFDYVTIGFGLRNVPDYLTVLKEMYRVVKPGGTVVCLETSQPTMIGFRQAYYFYFKFIMPLFGKLFAKSYKEYAWLHESAKDFPNKKELTKLFKEAGFKDIEVKSYTGGVAAMHKATK